MASKELTFFLIDVSPSMGNVRLPREQTDLEYAISYVKNHCSRIVVNNRKLDRIGFVLFNGLVSPLERITILFQDSLLTYDQLRHAVSQMCCVTDETPLTVRLPDFYAAAITALECFNAKRKLQYDRSLVIVSNLESETPSLADSSVDGDDEFCRLARELKVKVVLSIVDLTDKPHSPIKEANVRKWRRLLNDCTNGEIHDTSDMNRAMILSPCLKKIASHPIFSGQLRFGASLDKSAPLLDWESNPTAMPKLWISAIVHTFPACRHLAAHLTHGYLVSPGEDSLVRAQRKTSYYTKKYHTQNPSNSVDFRLDWLQDGGDQATSGFDKIPVEKNECVPGFRYSHEDIVALTHDLAETACLKTSPGIDVMGLLERDKIPYAMCVQDSQYVVPIANSLAGDKLSFNALANAMLNLKSVAIVRFVPSENADVQVAVLIPVEFAINGRLSLGFTLTALAFKEDESLGHFANLTDRAQVNVGASIPNAFDSREQVPREHDDDDTQTPLPPQPSSKAMPSKKTEDLMDSFVMARLLDTNQSEPRLTPILSNQKLALHEHQHLRLPSKAPFDPDTNLLPSCPSTYKFSNNLTKIISHSLTQGSLVSVLEDVSLVEKVLVDKNSSNLYNLCNILTYNTNPATETWLTSLNHKSEGMAKQLARDLDCQYHNMSAGQKKMKLNSANGDQEGKRPAPFDSFFDFDLII